MKNKVNEAFSQAEKAFESSEKIPRSIVTGEHALDTLDTLRKEILKIIENER